MNHDAMNNSDPSSHDRSFSQDCSSASGDQPGDDARKPFVKPELRRETGLVDGTASGFSNMSGD